MSAPVDSARQGEANGVRSVSGASAEVEQGGLSPNGGSSPPAQWQEAIEEAIGEEEATATPPTASKRSAEPVTTARSSKKGRKKSAADKIGKGKRVYCKKSTLFHILPLTTEAGQQQSAILKGLPPGQCLYGTVVSGNGKSGYTVKFDLFPQGQNELVVQRRQLTVVKKMEQMNRTSSMNQPLKTS